MKSLFKRLKERKGFTLVECIVAIAVFAAFCLMVMMIIAGAQRESKSAYDTEEELNTLVDNIMDDDINRRYSNTSSSSRTLNMAFDGSASGDFAITYDVVDGHKNYLVCDSCGYFAPNAEFCPNGLTEQFLQTAMNYVCPMCSHQPVAVTLECADCSVSGSYKNDSLFSYEKTSGNYVCKTCGGASVSSQEIQAELFSNAKLSVSGMSPNAIRYGTVKKPAYNTAVSVTDDTGAVNEKSKANIIVKYVPMTPTSNPTLPGTYSIGISSVTKPDPVTITKDDGTTEEKKIQTKVAISLPSGYYVEDFKVNGNTYNPATHSNVILVQPGYDNGKTGSITWTSTDASMAASFSFKLKNYKTGFSFDYDYQQVPNASGTGFETGGLAKYWFSLTNDGGSAQWPRQEPTS